jgi:ribosomal protein S4
MADEMRAPVESYKIGPEEKRFLKRFKDMLRAETLLQAIGQQKSAEMQSIIQMYGQVKQEKQRLLSVPPQVEEIPGQNFENVAGEEQIQQGNQAQEIQGQPDKWQMNY